MNHHIRSSSTSATSSDRNRRRSGAFPRVTLIFLCVLGALTAIAGPLAASPDDAASLEGLLKPYESVRLALLGDELAPVAPAAKRLLAVLEGIESGSADADALGVPADHADAVRTLLPEMRTAASSLAAADSLEAARDAFYALSQPLVRWLHHTGEESALEVAYCPMKKRSWVQPKGPIGNPYGGQQMPTCGSVVSR
ncbi:MAG: DUF3347 domain-containing protein [Acidobacteria bacterium]|nr:MAG: DUF3347 domain-containing protein [Acidobacteriota bacterium]REK03283.1 MAG: DUF3347 domain-containing protein [Acidobacteriota bacterium]